MRARLPLSALALAAVATLVIAAPAAAAPFTDGDVIVGGTTWNIYDFQDGSQPALDQADRADWDGNNETFDAGLRPAFLPTGNTDLEDTDLMQCADDGDLSLASDSTGDQIATCALDSLDSGDGTLDAVFELRFFSDGETVRARLIVTNNGATAVSGAHVGFDDNYYHDDDTLLGASTTEGHPAASDATVVDGDRLWIIYDVVVEDIYEVPVVLTAAGTADATVLPVIAEGAGNGGDDQVTLYPLPGLAPGQTVEVAQFWVWNFFEFDNIVFPFDEVIQDDLAQDQVSAEAEATGERTTVDVVTTENLIKSVFVEPAALFVPSALAAVEESWDARARFDTLSARDAAGIADTSRVLNWTAVAGAELADTGSGDVLPFVGFAALLLVAGAGLFFVRRHPGARP